LEKNLEEIEYQYIMSGKISKTLKYWGSESGIALICNGLNSKSMRRLYIYEL